MLTSARATIALCAIAIALPAAPAPAIDPSLLPPDTEAVLTINIRQMLNSRLATSNADVVRQLKTAVETHLADAEIQRWLEKCDLDLFRDVDSITVTLAGGKRPDLIIVEGKFNPDKLRETGVAASEENPDIIKSIKIGDLQAFEIHADANLDTVYAGLVGKDRLIAAHSKDAFAEAAARIKNGATKNVKLKKELREVIAAGKGKQSISLVSTGGALVKLTEDAPVPNIDQLQGVLQKITALSVSFTLEKSVNFELVVNSADKKSADEMAQLAGVGLAGAKMILKKQAETNPKLNAALDVVTSMRVTAMDNNVVLRGEVTAEMLAKIIKELPAK
jgi:hypothetical protein